MTRLHLFASPSRRLMPASAEVLLMLRLLVLAHESQLDYSTHQHRRQGCWVIAQHAQAATSQAASDKQNALQQHAQGCVLKVRGSCECTVPSIETANQHIQPESVLDCVEQPQPPITSKHGAWQQCAPRSASTAAASVTLLLRQPRPHRSRQTHNTDTRTAPHTTTYSAVANNRLLEYLTGASVCVWATDSTPTSQNVRLEANDTSMG